MSDDLLATARLALSESEDPVTVGPEAALHLAAWGTLAAAIDAAETLRRVEVLLATKAPAHAPTGTAAGDPSPPPAAGDAPQVGEVWEDTEDGERVRIIALPLPDKYPAYRCEQVPPPHNTLHRNVDPSDGWRRVSPAPAFEPKVPFQRDSPGVHSYTAPAPPQDRDAWRFGPPIDPPAPAPLTEREVTAEAQAQDGVEPASDEQIARIERLLDSGGLLPVDYYEDTRALIARVRAAEDRASEAEAQVALMRPVVDAAQEFVVGDLTWRDFAAKVRAYREATRGE